ncbi:MAG: AI-2E family transporter [Archaeoglobales archaeon]|nr:AI-2E family transporter [Archaeoglobales archaeon]
MDRTKFLTLVLIFSIFIAVFYFYTPLIDGIVMGVAFAYAARPIKRSFSKVGNLAASLIATLIIFLPASMLITYGLFVGLNQFLYILSHHSDILNSILASLEAKGLHVEKNEVYRILSMFFGFLQSKLSTSIVEITKDVVILLLNILISAVVCFFVLRDSERFVKNSLNILPKDRRDEFGRFILKIDKTLESLWFGNLTFAIIIGSASLPFFLIFKVPFAPLLAALMFLAALIPIFAEWMLILPVGIYLLLKDLYLGSLFLAIGFLFLYLIPEIFLRPYFVGQMTKIHSLLLMLAFIGGGLFGGLGGFFLAPMLVAVLVGIYDYYTTSQGS